MSNPCVWIVCAVCKTMTDAVTAVPMWFVNDTTITPMRGYICRDCGVSRLEAGILAEPIDRRTGGDDA